VNDNVLSLDPRISILGFVRLCEQLVPLESIDMIGALLFIAIGYRWHDSLDTHEPVLMLAVVILDLEDLEYPQVLVLRVAVHEYIYWSNISDSSRS